MNVDSGAPPRLPSKGLAVLAYCLAFLGAGFVYFTFRPTGFWLGVTVAVPALAVLWLATVAIRLRRQLACATSSAKRAYLRRVLPLMGLYVLVVGGEAWLHSRFTPTGPLAVGLAILPALPLIGVVWAGGRLIVEEQDEYLRSLMVRQFMIATGFMLTVTSIWGFLDAFGQVPHVPMYWAFILWCMGFGVGSLYNEMRS